MAFVLESYSERWRDWIVVGVFATKQAARERAAELHLDAWRVREC